MYRPIITTLYALLFPLLLPAQQAKLISATAQHWSGGIAGRSGINYTFALEFTGFRNPPELDTLWIGTQPIPVTVNELRYGQSNAKLTTIKKGYRLDITAGISRDESEVYHPHLPNETPKPKPPVPPREYYGVALLTYRYKGTKREFEVTKITKNYPPVAYP